MNRAGHYKRAEELAEEAVQVIAQAHFTQRRDAHNDAHLLLRRAMVHATLAAAVGADGAVVIDPGPPTSGRPLTMAERQAAGHPKPGPPPRVMS